MDCSLAPVVRAGPSDIRAKTAGLAVAPPATKGYKWETMADQWECRVLLDGIEARSIRRGTAPRHAKGDAHFEFVAVVEA